MIPTELRALQQWMLWKNIDGTKIPKQVNGRNAKSNEPGTWTDYETARAFAHQYDGLAFVISADDPFCGIDLDNCLDEDGNLKTWSLPIVSALAPVSFGEISPSGRGIKFVTQARKPKGAKCVYKVPGGDKEQIEIYDFGRFWTITENLYSDCRSIQPGQSVVDEICDQCSLIRQPGNPLSADREVANSQSLQAALPSSMDNHLYRRAVAYADKVPAPAPGNRNNATFNLAGHLYEIEDELGQRLSEDEVRGIVAVWSAQSPDPLDDAEIEKVCRSAKNNGTPREKKAYENSLPVPDLSVDYSAILNGETKPPEEVPLELIQNAPGLIGEIVRWMESTCLFKLSELFLGSSLALLSLITGRKVTDTLGGRTNLYLLNVGLTGSGKEHGRRSVKKILTAAGALEWVGPEDLASAAGLAERLVRHPSTLFQIDEFGYFLKGVSGEKAPPHLAQIESDLIKFYTNEGLYVGRAYADADRTPVIDQPHCVLSGSCTPGTLWDSLTVKQIHSGLIGRLQIFEAPIYLPLVSKIPYKTKALDPPQSILDAVRYWIDYQPEGAGNLSDQHPVPTLINWSPQAAERLVGHLRDVANRRIDEDPIPAALWSRSPEKANKLALIAACANQRFEVTIEDAEWAIRLQNSLTRKLVRKCAENVSESQYEASAKKLLAKITGKMTLTKLNRKSQWLKGGAREEVLKDLVKSGQVQITQEGEGVARTTWIEKIQSAS